MMKSALVSAVIAIVLLIGPAECDDGARKKRQAGINCVAMAMPVNGLLTYSPQPLGPYTSGSSVTLQCNLGFTPMQPTFATCQNGLWSPSQLGQCTSSTLGIGGVTTFPGQTPGGVGTQCAPMPVATGGYITYSTVPTTNTMGQQVYNPLTSATLNCNLGTSVMGGAQTSTCQNGMWSPTFGFCSGTTGLGGVGSPMGGSGQCPLGMTPPISGGSITYSQFGPPYNQNTVATLTCPAGAMGAVGTQPFGSVGGGMTATCTCMGTMCSWQPPTFTTPCSTTGITPGFGGSPLGQCSIAPTGGTITYTLNGQPVVNMLGPWQQGTTASLQCFGGTVTGVSTASCMNGIWTPTSILGPCSNTGLGGFTGGFGGSTLFPGVTSFGTSCLFAPIPQPYGSISYSGCSPFPCNLTGPWPQGVMANLMCNSGSTLTMGGSTSATCQGGTFSPLLGLCSAPTGALGLGGTVPFGTTSGFGTTGSGNCQILNVVNGVVNTFPKTTYPYDLNTGATLVCNPGYTAAGPTSATCLQTGWSVFPLGPCNQAIG